ncbi:hypothetical protein [Ectobacillus ponti]|uniref:Lipoprotein n=1 Tax=Ectobacillus ponti TaxID=2961894 RepID=A0AA41X825_9BACI|nr:hypothetical protein [Ectobacillus ponti]MCP8968003.1 hypothetical protein [Ectobacillus ponti]
MRLKTGVPIVLAVLSLWLTAGCQAQAVQQTSSTRQAEKPQASEWMDSGISRYNKMMNSGTEQSGDGTFQAFMKDYIMKSAQQALDKGADLSKYKWLTIQDGKVTAVDWNQYQQFVSQFKKI